MVTSVVWMVFRNQSRILSDPFCAGITTTRGCGTLSTVKSGLIFKPLADVTTSVVSDTAIKRNGGSVACGNITLSYTPHGPEKSITFTPSDMRMATLIEPVFGGVSFFAELLLPVVLLVSGFAAMIIAPPAAAPITVVSAAVLVKNSRRFIMVALAPR